MTREQVMRTDLDTVLDRWAWQGIEWYGRLQIVDLHLPLAG